MLKPYSELRNIDVTEYCETRKAKDEDGNEINVSYLPWAKCLDLLHEHGAEVAYYVPVGNEDGSFVFAHREVKDKYGKVGGCYYVKVAVHIDDKVYDFDYPLLNGALVVREETLNQLRISNAHARAFVKCVAIHTGLGFSLWINDPEDDKADDLSGHSIFAIKKRVEELLTVKLQHVSPTELYKRLGKNEKQVETLLKGYAQLAAFEKKLSQV